MTLHGHYGKTDEEMKDAETAKLYPWEKTDLVSGRLTSFLVHEKNKSGIYGHLCLS
mgnify:CR=1 FL=1